MRRRRNMYGRLEGVLECTEWKRWEGERSNGVELREREKHVCVGESIEIGNRDDAKYVSRPLSCDDRLVFLQN